MRVAIVEFAGRGGMIHYAYQLSRAMAALGADVRLVTSTHYELAGLPHTFEVVPHLQLWDPKPRRDASPDDVSAVWRTARRFGRAVRYHREWWRLAALLRRIDPDVVQFGDIRFPTDVAGLSLLRRGGLRLADICHNVRPFRYACDSAGCVRRSPLTRALYDRVYTQFSRVFVHFEQNRRDFLETFSVDARTVAAIPHGNQQFFEDVRNPQLTAPLLRRHLAIPADSPVVLLFGSLAHYKGADVLIRAFPHVLARHPSARLVVAGFPSSEFDVGGHRRLASSLGIERAVRIVTQYVESPDVAAWMELATVAVFPYRFIYQSGALHAAQTFGVPIVATRVGAFPEVVADGESGLLVPPDDPTALGSAIARLLDDGPLRLAIGRRAQRDARGAFGWESIARTILTHYDGLLREAS